ncbi:lipopolysaccharide biosynthesis protein [Neobacillus rhizosphaerae]|uniref:lipopolysaccharide biosynthesis protein n=1 Tax=Neobacillus rhizosphaerae TaxID=2880965 RepID=UPI0020102662|nr:oligosaccharide flippase family protein [Neobacillus rhizosphaerae]
MSNLLSNNPVRSLKGNFVWTFTGNVIYAICQWGIFIAITKLGTAEMVGQYALGLAITAPVFLFLNMNLSVVMVTDKRDQFYYKDYFILRLITLFLSMLIIFFLIIFFDYSFITLLVIILVGCSKVIESISDIFNGISQKVERMQVIAISKILKGVISLVGVIIVLYFTKNIIITNLSIIVSWSVVLLFFDYRKGMESLLLNDNNKNNNKVISRPSSLNSLKCIAVISFPLGVVASLDSLNLNIPRYFIQGMLGEESLGYFAAIVYLMVAGGTVIGALCQSSLPRLSQYYKEEKYNLFKTLLLKLLLIAFILGLLGIIIAALAGGTVLTLLYNQEYAQYKIVFILIMISTAFWYISSFLDVGINATQNFKMQIPIYAATILTSIGTSFYFIPAHQLVGGAIVVCIGMAVRFTTSVIVLRKIMKAKDFRNLAPSLN